MFQASVGDCSIPSLCCYWLPILFYPPAPPAFFVCWVVLFPPLLSPPISNGCCCITSHLYPLSISFPGTERCPPRHLPHPPPASLRRSSLRPALRSCLSCRIPSCFYPCCHPQPAPRSLSSPWVSAVAGPFTPLCPVSFPVYCSVSLHLLGLGSSGYPFCANLKDVTKVDSFIGIGTTVNKCFYQNGVAWYLPCVLYHTQRTYVCIFYLKTYHQIHGGHSVV